MSARLAPPLGSTIVTAISPICSSKSSLSQLVAVSDPAGPSQIPAVLMVPGAAFLADLDAAAVILTDNIKAVRANMFFFAHQFHIMGFSSK
jgi:hypothetical protein